MRAKAPVVAALSFACFVAATACVRAAIVVSVDSFGSGDNAFSIDFVSIGNPGNEADTTPVGGPSPVGRVDYLYRLGQHEISRDMIDKVNAAGGLGITMQDMSSFGGNGADRPATGITWNEAARFVNWLNTSKGYQAAYNFTTGGVNDNISVWGAGQFSGDNEFRHKDAYYFLPSVDEWYKGAFGSLDGTWFDYPTGSDVMPTSVSGGTNANTMVYNRPQSAGPADITNAGGLSAFGTMAQGGNAGEWMETAAVGFNDMGDEDRQLRSGSWYYLDFGWLSADVAPSVTYSDIGFRVASVAEIPAVPEPGTWAAAALLAGGAAFVRWRRRRDSGRS